MADPVQPYGSDPVFNSDSNLYRIDLYSDEDEFYNVSSADELNFQGVPRGFFPGEANGPDADGFPITVSTSVLAERASELMTALSDGRYLDRQTKSLDVRVMACNPNLQMMAFSTVRFEWEEGGTVRFAASPPRVVNLDVGVTPRNVIVLAAFGVLALALAGLAGLCSDQIRSLFRLISSTISALGNVFTSGSPLQGKQKQQPMDTTINRSFVKQRHRNLTYRDMMTELVILTCIVAGIVCHSLALAVASEATLTAKFPIYDAPQRSGARFFSPLRGEVPVTTEETEGNSGAIGPGVGVGTSSSSSGEQHGPHEHRWQLPIDTSGADALSTLVTTMSKAVFMSDVGYFFHSCALFLAILRLLGTWSFQPHFGVVTKTLRLAAPDLFSLMLVTSLMLVLLAAGAHLLIGNEFVEVSSPGKAIHFYFLYLITGDMPGLHKAMASPLEGNEQSQIEYISRRLAYILVPLLVSFMLLSFLLGIVSDSYVATLEQEEAERPNMLDEVVKMHRNRKRHRSAVRVLASATEEQRHRHRYRAPSMTMESAAPSSMGVMTRATAGSSQDVMLLVHVACVFVMEHNLCTPEQVHQCAKVLRRDVRKWALRGFDDVVNELDEALWAFTQRFASADDESLIEAVESEEVQLALGVVQVENMTWQLEDHLQEVTEMISEVKVMCDSLAANMYFSGMSPLERSVAWQDAPSSGLSPQSPEPLLDDAGAVLSVQGTSHSYSVPSQSAPHPRAKRISRRVSLPDHSNNSTRNAEADVSALKAHSAASKTMKALFARPGTSDSTGQSRRGSTPSRREKEEVPGRRSSRSSRRSRQSSHEAARASTAPPSAAVRQIATPSHKSGTRRNAEASPIFQSSSAQQRPSTQPLPMPKLQQKTISEAVRQARSLRGYRHSAADVAPSGMASGDAVASLATRPPKAHHRRSDTDALTARPNAASLQLPGQPQTSGAPSPSPSLKTFWGLFENVTEAAPARAGRQQRRSDLGVGGVEPTMMQSRASPVGGSRDRTHRHSVDISDIPGTASGDAQVDHHSSGSFSGLLSRSIDTGNLRRMAQGNSYRHSDTTGILHQGASSAEAHQQTSRRRSRDRLAGGVSAHRLPADLMSVRFSDAVNVARPSSVPLNASVAQPRSMGLRNKKLSVVNEGSSRNEECVIEDLDRNDD